MYIKLKQLQLIIFISVVLISCDERVSKDLNVIITQKIDWIHHADSLLMPFWMMDEALGNPPGNFPTNRYSDGRVIDPDNFDFSIIMPQAAPFVLGPTDSLRRDFVRIKSRQVYAYCIGYHLTGNEDYLIRAKQGLNFLIDNDTYINGSVVTFWQDGKAMPGIYQRNTQDLAYGLLGLTVYYYLTRDPEVLKIILKVKRNVWKLYFEDSELVENSKLMLWVKHDFENNSSNQKIILAPLDMLNAHLLLMTASVPDSLLEEYLSNVKDMAYSLKENFYSEKYNIFWGDLNNKDVSETHSDFGHSIKSFWMLYTAAGFTGDDVLKNFAERGAKKLLSTAFIKEKGSWASKYVDSSLAMDKGIFAWVFAELNQMCATLSLGDNSLYTDYLVYTYPYWEEKMIDYKYKETYWGRDAKDEVIDVGFKVGFHRSGFHSLEHALIGYLSTSNYYDDEINLYYAFNKLAKPEANRIKPYYYNAKIKSTTESNFKNDLFKNLIKTKVTFENIE